MKYRTFEDWFARGKVVKKGEQASGFLTDGVAIFSEEQVKKKPRQKEQLKLDSTPDSWYLGDGEDYM